VYVICVLTAVCPYGIAAQFKPSRYSSSSISSSKGKVIPLQARCGPDGG